MNDIADSSATMKFGVGQPMRRFEDVRLLTGQGPLPGRPDAAPADLVRVRALAARACADPVDRHRGCRRARPAWSRSTPATDYAADGLAMPKATMPRKKRDGSPMFAPQRPALVVDRARYVGDPVAMVIAETLAQAKDAAELVVVDYEPLPSVTSVAEAAEPDAPRVWDENPDNISHTFERGDRAATDAAFAQAAHIVKRRYVITRVHAQYMEPRGAIGTYDPAEDRYTLYADVNYPHRVRNMLANMVFKVPESKVRVVCRDVGGGFGAKGWQYVEHRLTLWAARKLERPVKWSCERSEVILADEHGRDNVGDDRAGVRRQCKDPRPAAAHAGQCRRLYRVRSSVADAVRPDRHRGRRVRHSSRLRDHRRGAVQHQSDRALSRRRPAGGDLSDRARDRGRGTRTGHRSDRTAPTQHHPAGEDAVQDGARSVLRLRRVRQQHGDGAGGRRLRRFRRTPRGVARARHAARYRLRQCDRAGRRPDAGICRNPFPAERQCHAADGHQDARPGPRDRRSSRSCASASASTRRKCSSSTATPTASRSAWARTARARWWSAAAR